MREFHDPPDGDDADAGKDMPGGSDRFLEPSGSPEPGDRVVRDAASALEDYEICDADLFYPGLAP